MVCFGADEFPGHVWYEVFIPIGVNKFIISRQTMYKNVGFSQVCHVIVKYLEQQHHQK
jgi:hypothetical protein